MQPVCYLTNPPTVIGCSKNPIPQILGIRLPSSIQHSGLRLVSTGRLRIMDRPRFGSPKIPDRVKML